MSEQILSRLDQAIEARKMIAAIKSKFGEIYEYISRDVLKITESDIDNVTFTPQNFKTIKEFCDKFGYRPDISLDELHLGHPQGQRPDYEAEVQ